jgi:hypothetical protein
MPMAAACCWLMIQAPSARLRLLIQEALHQVDDVGAERSGVVAGRRCR